MKRLFLVIVLALAATALFAEEPPAPLQNGFTYNASAMIIGALGGLLDFPIEFQHSFGGFGVDLMAEYAMSLSSSASLASFMAGPVLYFSGGIEGLFVRARGGIVTVLTGGHGMAFVADAHLGWNLILRGPSGDIILAPEVGVILGSGLSFNWAVKVGWAF